MAAGVEFTNGGEPGVKLKRKEENMSDQRDKLSLTDVQALITRANTTLPGPALAAQDTLRELVAKGESAFAEQVAYEAARRAVDYFG